MEGSWWSLGAGGFLRCLAKYNLCCCPSAGATVLQRSLKIKLTKEEKKIVWASVYIVYFADEADEGLGKNRGIKLRQNCWYSFAIGKDAKKMMDRQRKQDKSIWKLKVINPLWYRNEQWSKQWSWQCFSGMAKKDEFGHWKGSLILTSESWKMWKVDRWDGRCVFFFDDSFHVARSLAINLSSSVWPTKLWRLGAVEMISEPSCMSMRRVFFDDWGLVTKKNVSVYVAFFLLCWPAPPFFLRGSRRRLCDTSRAHQRRGS